MWAIKKITDETWRSRIKSFITGVFMREAELSQTKRKGGGVGLSKSEKKGIYINQKCHHWSGYLLVKELNCRHKFRKGYAALTIAVLPEKYLHKEKKHSKVKKSL